MILRKSRPAHGIRFAWLPVDTDEGKVWLEWVHFQWNDTEFGSYSYRRYVPDVRYDLGERAWAPKTEYDPKYPPGTEISGYATPPGGMKFCANFNPNGPTPCHYPHCRYRYDDNTNRCGAKGGDYIHPLAFDAESGR